MIIRTVKLTNFGIYNGEQTFDLSPLPTARFNRPLVVFRGKNGVGKSTLVNALRLCLHGSLALDSRVAQQEYDDYLVRLIHRNPDGEEQPTAASIEVRFDHVKLGKKAAYRIVREWARQGQRVVKTLFIWVDEAPVEEAQIEQKELFLRELVPPGLLNLFFFDGEKIQTLAEESDHSHQLLAETVRSLLGLDVVEQLGKDLDLFISRQRTQGQMTEWQQSLENLVTEAERLEKEWTEGAQRLTEVEAMLGDVRAAIARQEQKVSTEGGRFAQEREQRVSQQQKLEAEIENLRRQIMELCSNLFPFAIAPKLMQAVAARLEREKVYTQEQVAQEAIERRLARLDERLASPEFWSSFGEQLDPNTQQALVSQLHAELQMTADLSLASAEALILQVSDKERNTLQGWIEQALTEIPERFSETIRLLTARQKQLARLKDELTQTPTLESIQPLLSHLNQLHQQLGGLERERKELLEQNQRLAYRKEQVNQQRQRIRAQIEAQQRESARILLASKAQNVLEVYRARVTARKIEHLETLLTNRFNQLCRKKGFLQRVQIDPHTFAVTLHRMGKPFSRQQLSAGENQLFAIATLWALREISGRPMPVIVDTPLSRLDSEHRLSMMQEFFPFVSQQTLVLGTDIELDEDLYTYLQPAISHSYELSYYPAKGSTVVKHITPQADLDQTALTAQLALL